MKLRKDPRDGNAGKERRSSSQKRTGTWLGRISWIPAARGVGGGRASFRKQDLSLMWGRDQDPGEPRRFFAPGWEEFSRSGGSWRSGPFWNPRGGGIGRRCGGWVIVWGAGRWSGMVVAPSTMWVGGERGPASAAPFMH